MKLQNDCLHIRHGIHLFVFLHSPFDKVSWVRHADVHILAVGSQTFTTDTRFSASYFEDAGRFNLAIKRVRKSDEGTYECQISTKSIITFHIHLHVKGM